MNPAYISAAIDGAIALINLINKSREEARRAGTLTPEQDAEFDARLQASFLAPHWQVSGTKDGSST